jgi:hypothetical protein
MKLTKMSLVAALLVGSTAFAVENVVVDGSANLFYDTTDADYDLFNKKGSAADASLNLNVSAELAKNDLVTVSGKASYTVISTLGLENNMVSGVWAGSHTATAGTGSNFGAKVENASYFTEAYVTVAAGSSALQLGRMELDTPLAFTEAWTIEKNTFEAAVLVNTDIPDTTIVGAYIGNGNGTEGFGTQDLASGLGMGAVVNGDGAFETFGSDGAYALGVVNNSFKPLTVQAWYYNVSKLVEAYWLQADLACEMVPGLMAGVQYSAHELGAKSGADGTDSNVVAGMLGYEMKDTFVAKFAYSKVDDAFAAGFNTATDMTYAQSKLYTEAWWNYGQVTLAGAEAMNLTVEVPVADMVDLGLYTTMVDNVAVDSDLLEVTATASSSFGPLDASLAYIFTDVENADSTSRVQAYLTLNF